MRDLIISLLLLLLGTMAVGQVKDAAMTQWNYMKNEMGVRRINEDNKEAIQGSPYLHEEFVNGILHLKNEQIFTNVPMRINFAHSELQYTHDNIIYALADNLKIGEIILGEDTFVCEAYLSGNQFEQAFFQQLVSGETKLLMKINFTIRPAEPPKAYADAKPEEYIRQDDSYWIKAPNQLALKLTSLKKFIQTLEAHQEELNDFVKKEKISSKDKDELIRFFTYYNGLSQQQ